MRALAAAARANRALREVHVQTQPGAVRRTEATEEEEAARAEMEAVTGALAAVLRLR